MIRVHAVPRVAFYRPTAENGTPFSCSWLRDERVTTLSNGSEFHDAWRNGTDPTQAEPWTGATTFFVAVGPPRELSHPRVRSLPGGLVTEVRSLYQSALGHRRSQSSGWLWGAHRDRGIPKVDRPGPEVAARLQRVTKALRAPLGREMTYSTVILCDADAAELMMKAEPEGLGVFIPFRVDQDGGSYRERDAVILKSGGKELRVCAQKLFHWTARYMTVLPGRSEGRGVAVLSLVQSAAVKHLDLYDVVALKKAGCPEQWDHPSRRAAPAANATWFIHCCCEPGSKLSTKASRRFDIVDITKEDDFTRPKTVDRVLLKIEGPRDVCYYSSPCTGGSAWQNLNLKKSLAAGCVRIVYKLAAHFDLHWKLWAGFERVVEHCARRGATILWEWPRYCTYWKETRVLNLIRKCRFKFADFDGCM